MLDVCKKRHSCFARGGLSDGSPSPFNDEAPILYPAAGVESPLHLRCSSSASQAEPRDQLTDAAYMRLDGEVGDDAPLDPESGLTGVEDSFAKLHAWVAVSVLALGMSIAVLIESLFHTGLGGRARGLVLPASVPIVALCFTWFHVWLALQMLFRPAAFRGLWQFRRSGRGLGWQGVVPRNAEQLGRVSFSCARPYLDGPRDWMARVDARALAAALRPELEKVIRDTLCCVGEAHSLPAGQGVPDSERQQITDAVLDNIETAAPQLWREFTEHLCHERLGVDDIVQYERAFVQNRELIQHFFRSLGEREFRAIECFGAAMGFVGGLVQLVALDRLDVADHALLFPLTGFFLGLITNWLAILAVFKPCSPWPVRLCGRHIGSIQGILLKRQRDVAALYAELLCDRFKSFDKAVDYLRTLPELWYRLTASYAKHTTRVVKVTAQADGSILALLMPLVLGQDKSRCLEGDLKSALVEGLRNADHIHEIVGQHIEQSINIWETTCAALVGMPADAFEKLLHPISEARWILILLGGVVGAIAGQAQAWLLLP